MTGQVVDLYANHPDTYVEFLGGRYKGKVGVERLYVGRFSTYFVKGRNGPIQGFLLDHPQHQGIVDVAPDGKTAKGRFRSMMQAGTHKSIKDIHPRGLVQWWEGGLYENEYIKEDGVWKIWKLRYFPFWHGTFEEGWSNKDPDFIKFDARCYPENPEGPDVALDEKMLWPDTRCVPFHYVHPVTGKPVADDDLRAPGYGEDVSTSAPALVLSE
jgi:SnoaL-like domain